MFYFYYPVELESSLGPATISIKTSEESIPKIELLRRNTVSEGLDNCYLFYPTLSSLLSQCILDLELRSKVISEYDTLSNELFELKKKSKNTIICIGVSVIGNTEVKTNVRDISYKVSFSSTNSSLKAMLSEYFVHKNRKLKKSVGSLSAISQFMEEIEISDGDMQSDLDFLSDSLFIKSNFGGSSEIASSLALLDDKSKYIEKLSLDYEDVKKQYSIVNDELEEQLEKHESLKADQKRAIHQIQILQESLVEKHQESSLKESEIEQKYLKQISALNSENNELLNATKLLESECNTASETLDKSIREIQKLQEQFEDKSLEVKRLMTMNSELVKENSLLASKILEINEEQMNSSLAYATVTEQVEKDKKQSIAKQKVLERELTRLKSRNAELTHKYSSLRYKMFCTNRELELIQSSPFWKGSRLLKNLKSKLNKNKISDSVKADIALIATSEYFDFDWYLETYGDVQEANVDPAQHYLIAGAEEGRLPGPNFDGNWYLERYPDVAEAEINPLLHFIKCGKREGRVPSPKMLADKRKV
ncbi:hypothetical protein [Alteromonas sp. 009811495]|uniref:hypothetical protein n=1 Tax=Alteromonas sp. 009811495 TaxID=3002962 RepID=UPI00237DDD07|nr:hypothetical protein [Alteromonas sp. 009811495]WDT85612.1 hypothetical protein OZ660_17030 [Alteromonas sp. 009811495]